MSDRPTPERLAHLRKRMLDGIEQELWAEIDALTRERDYLAGKVTVTVPPAGETHQ